MPVVDRAKERELVQKALARGMSDEQIKKAVLAFRAQNTPKPTEEESAPGFMERLGTTAVSGGKKIVESLKKRGGFLKESIGDVAKGKITPQSFLQTRVPAAAIGFGGDLVGVAATEGTKLLAPKVAEKVGGAVEGAIASPTGQAIVGAAEKVGSEYKKFAEANPSLGRDISSIATLASAIPIAKPGQLAVGTGKSLLSAGRSAVGSAVKVGERGAEVAKSTLIPAAKETAVTAKSALVTGFKKAKGAVEAKAAQASLLEPVRDLHRAGIPEETIARITTASPATKSVLVKMVDKVKSRLEKVRLPGGKLNDARAVDVVGEEITSVASRLSQSARAAGKELGKVKEGLKGVDVEITPVQEAIAKDISDLRLKVEQGGKIVAPKNVPVDPDVLEVLNDVYKYIGSGQDAEILDMLRTFLRKTYNKAGTPFNDNATRLLQKYQSTLLDTISAVDSNYGVLARQYAEQMTALKAWAKWVGFTGDMEDIASQALKVGEKSRRILGNASAVPRDILDELLEQAKKAGVGSDVNIDDLIRFADDLDDIAGITQTTGLEGAVIRGGEAVAQRAGGGITERALSGLVKLGTPGAAERLKALQSFLRVGRFLKK